MSIVFCNQCFDRAKSRSGKKYFCTSCSHIFCSSCLNSCPNFCLICQTSCKVLEINEMMPASVKIFFETEEGFQKRIKEAEKVNQFQNSQVKMFVKKHQELRLKYYRLKKEYSAIAQKEKNLRTAIQEEQAIIAKCKMSYRTNVIDPALFVDPVVDMSIDSNSTSEYVTSPFFDNPKSRKVMETTTLSDNMSQMNMNCSKSDNRQKTNSQSQADKLKHQCKQTLPDTRKKLLENTLQHMHNISQNKYTILQRTKM